MQERELIDIRKCFKAIMKTLRQEDRYLRQRTSIFEKAGISDLDEKNLQFILYKVLLKTCQFPVYIEDKLSRPESKMRYYSVYTRFQEQRLDRDQDCRVVQ